LPQLCSKAWAWLGVARLLMQLTGQRNQLWREITRWQGASVVPERNAILIQ
jgi:hypothetical protein